jgi:hypothetical protein
MVGAARHIIPSLNMTESLYACAGLAVYSLYGRSRPKHRQEEKTMTAE